MCSGIAKSRRGTEEAGSRINLCGSDSGTEMEKIVGRDMELLEDKRRSRRSRKRDRGVERHSRRGGDRWRMEPCPIRYAERPAAPNHSGSISGGVLPLEGMGEAVQRASRIFSGKRNSSSPRESIRGRGEDFPMTNESSTEVEALAGWTTANARVQPLERAPGTCARSCAGAGPSHKSYATTPELSTIRTAMHSTRVTRNRE